ncbi:MAG: hypothetical protein HQK71_06490 [Desulfamplus sp.]|nr:hypothetical protein [Desulfamplus sp.]
MGEIKHNLLKGYLDSLSEPNAAIPPIFFIWGDEFLCRKAFDAVISFLLSNDPKSLGYELIEGEEALMPSIIERISTYSFFEARKVVAIKDVPLFGPSGASSATAFFSHDLDNLKNLLEKGFPQNHYLVITASSADKRRNLFNTIKTLGLAIDCTVAQGSGKADKDEQKELLRLTMIDVMDRTGKGIDGDAFQALIDMTGFDPATLKDNLERLSAFIGSRDKITIKDVQSVVRRSKKDPIFELTNAVAQKNLEQSLFYYKSLCDNGFHPLQLLSSIVNQMRKIFVVKTFIDGQLNRENSCWRSGNQNYQQFTANTIPFVTKVDKELEETLTKWSEDLRYILNKEQPEIDQDEDTQSEDNFEPEPIKSSKGKKKGKSSLNKNSQKGTLVAKTATDLIIASNPKSSYPVFQTFLRADKFSLDELSKIMVELSEMDYKFKSSSDGDPFIILEEMIIRICINLKMER